MLPTRPAVGVKLAVLPLTLTVPVTGEPPVVVAKVKLAVVSVEFVIGFEKVADIAKFRATPVTALPGDVEDTVGGVVSGAAAVVKPQTKFIASALPAASFAAVVMAAVYRVLAISAADGWNVAVLPLTFTVPLTTVPPTVGARVKLAVVSVEFVIGLEKVADIEEFVATPVVPCAGDTADTVGGVVSGAAPVAK